MSISEDWSISGKQHERIKKPMLRMVYEDYDSPYEDLLAKCHMSTQEC